MLALLNFDAFVVWLNLSMAATSLVIYALAVRYGNPEFRWLFLIGSFLSALYVVSYSWLLLDYPHTILQWSRVMRGVSLLPWFFVWQLPVVMSIKTYRKRLAAAGMLQRKVHELEGSSE